MRELQPEGEDLRRALQWVSGQLRDDASRPVAPLVKEAIFKFDLSPRDAELLIEFYAQRKSES